MKTLKPTRAVKDEVLQHLRHSKGNLSTLPEQLKRLPQEVLQQCLDFYHRRFVRTDAP